LYNRLIPLLLTLLLFSPLVFTEETFAEESIQSLRQSLDNFMSSPDHRFAPATAAKAQAYLGAAMLAEERTDAEELAKGIEMAESTLTAAKETAASFKAQFPDLIKAKAAATSTIETVGTFDPLKEPNPKRLMQDADKAMDEAVNLFEKGDLNRTRVSATTATEIYKKALDAALPPLLDMAGATLGEAASNSARKYAPQSYAAAENELNVLEQYVDGINPSVPEHPLRALQLAQRALEIARQVKIWRKDNGSHEGMALKARGDRLELAKALGIAADYDDPSNDISHAALMHEVKQLKSELNAEREGRKSDREQLKAEYDAKLAESLEAERSTLLNKQNEQMSDLKEAFRAKLERETFDSKRQKQLRALFKEGGVEVLVNVDGSVLMRLTGLKFASGSSKIDPTSYDLLGRVKRALEIYGERKVRIEGHTDSKGDVKINQKISLKRAESVRDFLIAASMDGSRLKALGYGEVRPIASNEFAKGRAMNRRIDIVIEAAHD
jgi:outer membrane protein OmpA-like peptidoglycan-associated protein